MIIRNFDIDFSSESLRGIPTQALNFSSNTRVNEIGYRNSIFDLSPRENVFKSCFCLRSLVHLSASSFSGSRFRKSKFSAKVGIHSLRVELLFFVELCDVYAA